MIICFWQLVFDFCNHFFPLWLYQMRQAYFQGCETIWLMKCSCWGQSQGLLMNISQISHAGGRYRWHYIQHSVCRFSHLSQVLTGVKFLSAPAAKLLNRVVRSPAPLIGLHATLMAPGLGRKVHRGWRSFCRVRIHGPGTVTTDDKRNLILHILHGVSLAPPSEKYFSPYTSPTHSTCWSDS